MIRLIGEILLVLFLILYGLAAVSNFRFAFMEPITGLAAMFAGFFLAGALFASNVRKGV